MPQPDFCKVQSMISRGLMVKPRCSAPTRLASAQTTSWLERHSPGTLDQLRAEQDVLVSTALVDVVVLQEHGGRQHHVRHLRGRRHELLVHAHEQVLACEARLDLALLGRDLHRVHVLDEAAPSPAGRP